MDNEVLVDTWKQDVIATENRLKAWINIVSRSANLEKFDIKEMLNNMFLDEE